MLALIDFRLKITQFPELMKHKPETGWFVMDGYWFDPCDKIRVKILEEVIDSMKVTWIDWLFRIK
jgi:hypothetical protein